MVVLLRLLVLGKLVYLLKVALGREFGDVWGIHGCGGVQAIRVSCPYRLSGTTAVAYARTELLTGDVGISIMIETSGTMAIRNE